MSLRKQDRYKGLSRWVITNHYKTDVSNLRREKKKVMLEEGKTKPQFGLHDFLIEKIWSWLVHTFKHLLGTKVDFKSYGADDNGIYPKTSSDAGKPIVIAMTADWANDTAQAIGIAQKIKEHNPDYTIHLGDTYYVGEGSELDKNFSPTGGHWHRGTKGSFALMGNHEMYSMGRGYYGKLLPSMGIVDTTTNKCKGQGASYFCLQTDHWLIIGLDTGYNSISFPFVWNYFRSDCHLDDKLIEWLQTEVKPLATNKGLIFLSHHQYVSAFEKEKDYSKPAEQLAEVFHGREVIWLWGHEHRFAMYNLYESAKGIRAHGRCIGHGAMPVELERMKVTCSRKPMLVCFDARPKTIIDRDNEIGWNGYATFSIHDNNLTITYYDEKNEVAQENWNVMEGVIKSLGIQFYKKAEPGFIIINNLYDELELQAK